MGLLGNPFRLFGRFTLASFRIAGYSATFVIQVLWFVSHRRMDKIADAFGDFGRSVTDAAAGIFHLTK